MGMEGSEANSTSSSSLVFPCLKSPRMISMLKKFILTLVLCDKFLALFISELYRLSSSSLPSNGKGLMENPRSWDLNRRCFFQDSDLVQRKVFCFENLHLEENIVFLSFHLSISLNS